MFIGIRSLLNDKVTKALHISVVSYNVLADITSFKNLIRKLHTMTINREELQIIHIVKEIEVLLLNPILSNPNLSNEVLLLEKQTLKPKGKGKVKGQLVSSSIIEGLASTKKVKVKNKSTSTSTSTSKKKKKISLPLISLLSSIFYCFTHILRVL